MGPTCKARLCIYFWCSTNGLESGLCEVKGRPPQGPFGSSTDPHCSAWYSFTPLIIYKFLTTENYSMPQGTNKSSKVVHLWEKIIEKAKVVFKLWCYHRNHVSFLCVSGFSFLFGHGQCMFGVFSRSLKAIFKKFSSSQMYSPWVPESCCPKPVQMLFAENSNIWKILLGSGPHGGPLVPLALPSHMLKNLNLKLLFRADTGGSHLIGMYAESEFPLNSKTQKSYSYLCKAKMAR